MQEKKQLRLPFDTLNEAMFPAPTDPFALCNKLPVFEGCTTILAPLVFLIEVSTGTDIIEFRLLPVWSIPGVGIIVLMVEEDDI